MTWPDLTGRPRSEPDHVFRYGGDSLQVVDLWLPKGTTKGRWPTILMVHGGCWQSAIADRRLMDWAAGDLRDRGFAVWNIDYRGVDRDGGGYPGTFRDVAAAADLLRDHADACHLDLSRVVAVGHSAGGHLALWLAARHRLPVGSVLADGDPLPIAHVVSLGGLPDLAAVESSPDNGCGTDVIARLVGDRPDRFADTSVPCLLPIGVPVDLLNGRDDRIVPARMAPAFATMAQEKGDEVTVHEVADTGHVELISPGTPAWEAAINLVWRAASPGRQLEI
ncbi:MULTISPECIES: alpha/beta hydrolase family protein [Sphingomonas]|uniref:Esterase n=1 Tax=Sphingomonas hankookensis TaxID=563996 RepID=A0ABR5YHA5_9SPHN|nr:MULTISPECIES: alpha/beta hydrolase [Sphingomonas]KZE18765.1 esterase [Sphingomonas hankookensis]PZT93678.1 MAG: alpha/beta hydrolase [Sphingomonas sp.]WCP70662.1 alpha/beta hydrolase [Sphingomonas hankookensis]